VHRIRPDEEEQMMTQASTDATAPVVDRRELSRLAYGFMASKALFAALGIDLFSRIDDGSRTVAELAAATGVPGNRVQTLLHALAGIGLVVHDGEGYANAPAAGRYLVRGAPADIGDYLRLQVAQQIYPALLHLDAGLAGTDVAFAGMTGLLADPQEARTFSASQHAGSIGAARALAGRLDLAGPYALLDVGGGSGAFSIAFCERTPALRATILDLPAVVEVAREFRDRAALTDRITLLAADAVHDPWPRGQDVVLMSYLLSALGDDEIDVVLAKARACLRPGGQLVVHDFMLHDDRPGPAPAALWFLQYLAYRPDAVSFSAATLAERLARHGFAPASTEELIPEITTVILSRKADPR
jgi:ubiquinone/menaquinone biosynthesis C-methylase UbiE